MFNALLAAAGLISINGSSKLATPVGTMLIGVALSRAISAGEKGK